MQAGVRAATDADQEKDLGVQVHRFKVCSPYPPLSASFPINCHGSNCAQKSIKQVRRYKNALERGVEIDRAKTREANTNIAVEGKKMMQMMLDRVPQQRIHQIEQQIANEQAGIAPHADGGHMHKFMPLRATVRSYDVI